MSASGRENFIAERIPGGSKERRGIMAPGRQIGDRSRDPRPVALISDAEPGGRGREDIHLRPAAVDQSRNRVRQIKFSPVVSGLGSKKSPQFLLKQGEDGGSESPAIQRDDFFADVGAA